MVAFPKKQSSSGVFMILSKYHYKQKFEVNHSQDNFPHQISLIFKINIKHEF